MYDLRLRYVKSPLLHIFKLSHFFIFLFMKKFIIGIDLFGHLLILLLGTAFLVYQNNFFAGQMMWICWLPFCIYLVFNLASFKELPSFKQSIFSILNIFFLSALVALNRLSLIEFFLSTILAELVAISIAISYFFLFKKGLNDMTAKELFGEKSAILMAIVFTIIIYPYIGEAVIYIGNEGLNIYLITSFILTLIFGVTRQIKSIGALVARRNKNPELVWKELDKALDQSQPMDFDTRFLLISLGLWFVGIGAIWAVYSYNA